MRKIKYILLIVVMCLLTACSATQSLHSARQAQTTDSGVSLDTQLDKLCREIGSSLAQQNKPRIAVMEFTDLNGNASDLEKFLAEELTTKLFAAGKFQVIERRLIEKILTEQKLNMTGLVDEKTAAKVGSLLGVDFIATGTTADLGTSVKVNARIISVERGAVFSVASINITKNDQVKLLMGKNTTQSAMLAPRRDKSSLTNEQMLLLNDELFDAVEKGQTDRVRDLVRQGADVNVRGIAGRKTPYPTKEWTPLIVASDKGYAQIALILLENGADVHAQNWAYRTSLHYAAEKGHADIVRMLLAKGADVQTSSFHDQWTPLHIAAYRGQTTVALILLEAGADPFIKNIQGSTPLDYAREKGLNAVVKAIEALPKR